MDSFEPGSNRRPRDDGYILQSHDLPTDLSKVDGINGK